ncbi:MAG: T9SS type A sorting domain-containing protein [Paludibacter sp.]|nr:T9SS type A sorting domain-containing protein [Paludibacter sp.]
MINTYTPSALKSFSPVFLVNQVIKMSFRKSERKQTLLQAISHKAMILIAFMSLLPIMSYAQTFTLSSTNPAIIGSTINQGASNQPIYAAVVQVTGSGWGGNFNKLTFTATGTFATTDINYAPGVSGYKVWASTTNNLSTASQISNPYQAESSGTQVSITVNNKPFNVGETWFVWITADISSTAVGGHTLAVGALTTNDFSFSNVTTKSGTMYAGGTQIIGTKATYNSNGSYTFTVPPGVYSINVEAWGAGAGGSNSKNKGGGGGAYAGNPAISVIPGTSYTVTVGQGGTAGNNGQNSSFSSLVIAAGATGANGGTTANSTGAITFAGGNGGISTNNGGAGGGGSGGAGGAGGNGGNTTNNNAGAGGLAGIAGMGSTGGAGGVGGYCVYYSKWYQEWFPGNNGNSPGGGGGENSDSGSGSGAGANGQVLISWTAPASMWYKADVGTGTTTNGTDITTWDDQSGSSNNATSQTTPPTFQALGWNFNPSVSFSSGYFLTGSNNLFNDMTFFTVYNTGTTGGGAVYNCPAIIGGEVSGVQDDYYLSLMDGKPLFKAKNVDDNGAISTIVTSDNSPRILSATHKRVLNGHNLLYINGNLAADQDMGNSGDATLSKPVRLGIGNHYNPSGGSQFNGNISEVVGSSSVFTTSDRENFESYLAIKYGITLTHDYTNSVSTSIYPIAGYSNDIAGLGRNDTWKLHQKVSASSNMTSGNSRVVMATSNDFINSNLDAGRTALTNGQYLIWGHNNGSTSTWTAIGSTPIDSIVSRVWKVVNTGSVGSVYFQIDLTGYTSENGIYRLLVDNNTDFTTGVTSYVLTKTSGNLYTTSTPVNFASGVRYFTIAQKGNFWKGTSTSTDWGTPTNWTAGEIPPPGAKVEYATDAANNLVLDLPERTVSRVINTTTWNLTIPAGKALTVNNSIITDKNPDRILIQTRTATPEVANGSLIFHNNAANPVYGTVEMYSKAHIDESADINGDQRYFWQYFGIPVETLDADPTLYGAYVRRSNEAGTDQDENYYWKELGTYDKLTKFLGYEICQPAAKKYTFTGKLVNTDLDSRLLAEFAPTGFLPFSNNGSSVDGLKVKYPGEHLFANAYTAAINVDKIEFGSALDKTVFLYNTGSYGQWLSNTGGSTDGTAEGQYLSIPQNLAGFSGIPGQIPSMSSFLVKTGEDKTVNSYIKINYNDALIKNTTIQRVKSIDAISNTDLVSTMIDLTGLHYSDRMWIFSEPSCTRNFDNGWDGRKILGSSLAPQIYAMEPDGDYQVNSVSDMHNTDLAFQAGDEVEYTLKFTHENIQRQYAGVYLVDLVENKTVDVSQNGSTYSFATAQSDAPAKRFKILTRPYEKGAPDKETQVKIFTAPGRVFVHNLSTFKGECTLYDIAGRTIKNVPFEANAVTEVLNNLAKGAYVVNTITNGEKVSKRVIVQ